MTDIATVVGAGVLGLLIGSFLNVVIHRVPVGASVVSPSSACPGCQAPISPRDNVPILSWLLLRARCRHCGEPISARYPAVEVLTAVLFAAVAARVGMSWELPAWLYLAGVGIALAVIDLDTRRLPDRLTLPSYPIAFGLLLLPAVVEGRWDDYRRALIGAVVLLVFYVVLVVVYPAGMGLGDVKLSGVLGAYLGWLGWGELAVGAFLGFALGAVVGLGLMLFGDAGRKTKIPFGPFMIAGAVLTLFVGGPIVDWYLAGSGIS